MRLPLILVFAALVIFQNAAAQSNDVSSILEGLPRGSDDVRGNWLYRQAKLLTNAESAYELMTIITNDYGGEAAVQARLWKIRYHLAGQELVAAKEELSALPPETNGAPDLAERRYWRTLLGEETSLDASARETGIPPWVVMTHLAAVPTSENISGRDVRRTLALEGVVRRWGLLAPWLWRLVASNDNQLKKKAEEYLVLSSEDVRYDPGIPALNEVLSARSWIDDTPAPKDPLYEPTTLPEPVIDSTPGDSVKPSIFAIQVGAFLNATAANALVRELGSHGFSAYCREPDDNDLLHRVRIGPVPTLAAAESLGLRLSETLMLPYQIVEE
jgi:SPOR domain